jgi:hypothetical protein
MSNKYLTKISEFLTDENKAVAKTFAETAAIGLPAHAAGAWAGEKLGAKFLKKGLLGYKGSNAGQFIGMTAAGGLADILAMKHSLHGSIKKQG